MVPAASVKKRLFGLAAAFVLLFALICPSACAETAVSSIPMHLYTDPTDGTTMMLPDGWTEETHSQGGYKAYVSWTQHEGSSRDVIFLHLCIDDWSSGRTFFSSRTAYDAYMNQVSSVSAALGGASIEEVVFNGISWFRYYSQDSTWQYFRYHNGYVHLFQIDVDTDDPYYAYFEAIMNSVVFPEIR